MRSSGPEITARRSETTPGQASGLRLEPPGLSGYRLAPLAREWHLDSVTSEAEAVAILAERRAMMPGQHELAQVRLLEDAELAEIQRASGLISAVGSSAGLRRLGQLTELTLERISVVESRDRPAAHEIESCLAALGAMVMAETKLLENIDDLLTEAADTPGTQDARDGLSALQQSARWSVLSAAATRAYELARDRNGLLVIRPNNDDVASLSGVAQEAFVESQDAYMLALAARAADVLDAGQRLRRLHAECPEGVPSWLYLPTNMGDADHGSFTLTPHELPIQLVSEALRVARLAESIATQEEAAESGPGAVGPLPDVSEAGRATMEASSTQAKTHAQGDHPSIERDRREADLDTGAQEAGEGAPGEAEPGVVDLPGLLAMASTLNTELERAWSGALSRAVLEEGVAVQTAAVRAALSGFQRRAATTGVRVEEFPPSGPMLAEMETDSHRGTELLVLSQLTAFENVLQGLQALVQPSAGEVRFEHDQPESLKRFWGSGAFAQLAGRLDLLRSLMEEEGLPPEQRPLSDSLRHLKLAQAAWRSGDPEGCLFHGACGLASQLDVPALELETRLVLDDENAPDIGDAELVAVGVRTLVSILSGEPNLHLGALTGPALVEALSSCIFPGSREGRMPPQDWFEIVSRDVPFEPLQDG